MTKLWPFCLAFNVLMHYGWRQACSHCWLPRLHALYTWVSTRIQYLQYITSGDMTVLCRASFRIHWPMCNQLCLMAGRLLLHQSRSSIKQYFNFCNLFFCAYLNNFAYAYIHVCAFKLYFYINQHKVFAFGVLYIVLTAWLVGEVWCHVWTISMMICCENCDFFY